MPDVVYDSQIGLLAAVPQYLKQVTNSSFDPNLDILEGRASGNPTIADQFVMSAEPQIGLTTADVGGFMTLFGTLGALVPDGSTISVPYQKRASGGTFQGGATNLLVKGVGIVGTAPSGSGVLMPQSVNAPRMGACSAQGQIYLLSGDGLVQPWAMTPNNTLPAQNFSAMYGCGPCFINGVHVPRQVGFTVTFGLQWSDKQHYDGAVYASDIFMEQTNPIIEIQVEDFDQLAAITGGSPITGVTAYMRKRLSGSTYVLDTLPQHIKFSFASGMISPQQMSAAETKHGSAAIRLEGRVLVASSASAVTAP